jgi:hypothetical protein
VTKVRRPQTEHLFGSGDSALNRSRGPLVRALGRTVAALHAAGTLEAVDELTVAGARAAARLAETALADLDESTFTRARALSELGAWHDRLRPLGGAGADALDAALELLNAPVPE